jgi:hypothetical protein
MVTTAIRGPATLILCWPQPQGYEDIECCNVAPSKAKRAAVPNKRKVVVEAQEDLFEMKRRWRVFRRNQIRKHQKALEGLRRMEEDKKERGVEEEETEERQEPFLVERLIRIDCREEEEDTSCELILPNVLFRENETSSTDDESSWDSLFPSYQDDSDTKKELWNDEVAWEKQQGETDNDTPATSACTVSLADSVDSRQSGKSWQSKLTEKADNTSKRQLEMTVVEDDPWTAAKRGDLIALQRWTHRHDWTQEDDFGNVPLYYACHSGAARNLRIVDFLLQQWPTRTAAAAATASKRRRRITAALMDHCKKNAINATVVHMLNYPDKAEEIILEAEELSSDDDEDDHLGGLGIFAEEEEADY